MALKIYAASNERDPGQEQASRALRIAVVSERALYLLSVHLYMCEMIFFSTGKVLAPFGGRLEGVYRIRGSH